MNSSHVRTAIPGWILAIACIALAPAPAHAQSLDRDGEFHRHERRRPEPADTTRRTLEGKWQIWGHAGAGWMSAPKAIRQQYLAGLDGALSGDMRLADRAALRARLDVGDLPSSQYGVLLPNGTALIGSQEFGHGWHGWLTGGAAIRTISRVWIESGAGVARFGSGYGDAETSLDPTTGQLYLLPIRSGWGSVWTAGVRYEFQPTRRDRMLSEVQFATLNRDGDLLRFFAIRVGYRLF